jgi:two-component system cell cycle response regulator DivK
MNKILLAEDDRLSLSYLRTILERQGGYVIIHANNGEETVQLVRENPDLSLVLMDIKMPGMDGLQATREIREFNESIPIIAQTAFALPGNKEHILEGGFTDYISKPIDRNALIEMVEKYIKK